MFHYAVLFFGVLASVCCQFSDDEKAEMHKLIHPTAMKCLDELDIPLEQFETLKKSHNLARIDPCFLACVFKENALINVEGMFDKDASITFAEQFVKNEDAFDRVKKIAEECMAVNEEKVTDGEKGCERAQLLADCFEKHKSGFVPA